MGPFTVRTTYIDTKMIKSIYATIVRAAGSTSVVTFPSDQGDNCIIMKYSWACTWHGLRRELHSTTHTDATALAP